MNVEVLVSVVITTYKRKASVLKRALDSVIHQNYRNLEIIVVNDSPNYTERNKIDELIETYYEKYHIQYIVNPCNLGGNAARNIGIKSSSGEYIAFLDDDDEFLPEKISVCSNEFCKEAGIIYSDIYLIESNGSKRILKRKTVKFEYQLEELLAGNYVGGFSSVIIKKELLLRVGLLDEQLRSYQDIDLWIRLAKLARFVRIEKPLLNYYITNDSVSLNSEAKINGLKKFMAKHRELYEKFPKSKNIKIDSEIIYFCKNGWLRPAFLYYNEIYHGFERIAHLGAIIKGIMKCSAVIIYKKCR